jgi:hypothetical protein
VALQGTLRPTRTCAFIPGVPGASIKTDSASCSVLRLPVCRAAQHRPRVPVLLLGGTCSGDTGRPLPGLGWALQGGHFLALCGPTGITTSLGPGIRDHGSLGRGTEDSWCSGLRPQVSVQRNSRASEGRRSWREDTRRQPPHVVSRVDSDTVSFLGQL